MILVFSIYPKGCLEYEGCSIPGFLEPFEPCDVSFTFYQTYKENLRLAEYNKKRLERIFQKSFPDISFTYREIKYLTEQQVLELNTILGIVAEDATLNMRNLKRLLRQKHGA